MISPIGFNSIAFSSKIDKSRLNRNVSFTSSDIGSSDFSSFLESKTYDYACVDKSRDFFVGAWPMSDNDMIFLANKKATVIDFDYDKIMGTKKFAKNLGLKYLGLDDIADPKNIKACYRGIVNKMKEAKGPVLLHSFRAKDEPFYMGALYMIKEKGISVKEAAEIIEHKILIQPRFDLIEALEKMLKQLL
ncbi:MAG TPA: hypothetical protein PLG15_04325 [Candidatus Gastranaerophilaceae bacterium]|nr:hypothetical protein [Candidatus Gastranaerophilaceae bacterium]HPT41593.1 hypothetical protein [Candidatus Gastranaerophilaceae bacterium]